MKKLLLLAALAVTGCGSATEGPTVLGSTPTTSAGPNVSALASPAPLASSSTAAFRKEVADAIAKLEDPWALFCVSRGSIEQAMPPQADLLTLDADPRISSATDVLIDLASPPKGWLEVANSARSVGVTAADATLADILLRAQVEQGASPAAMADDWSTRVLAPCATVRAGIVDVKELLDKLP